MDELEYRVQASLGLMPTLEDVQIALAFLREKSLDVIIANFSYETIKQRERHWRPLYKKMTRTFSLSWSFTAEDILEMIKRGNI